MSYQPLFAIALASCLLTLSACQHTKLHDTQTVHNSSQVHSTIDTEHSIPTHEKHWGYTQEDIMPDHWGDKEINKLCEIGHTQSPINIQQVIKAKNKPFNLQPHYQTQDFMVKDNGHTIVFTAKNPVKSTLTINDKTYQLLQFHYHYPSEHTVMNEHSPLELHFVHRNKTGGLAVVGVLVNEGAKNQNIKTLLQALPNQSDSTTVASLNVESFMPKDSATYAYDGSLTTPPCSEHVQWLLKADPIFANHSQLNTLAKLYNGNNRPVNSQNGRKVYFIN